MKYFSLAIGILLVIGWFVEFHQRRKAHRELLEATDSTKEIMWMTFIREETDKGISLFFGLVGLILVVEFFFVSS